jgi:hypothetical protein
MDNATTLTKSNTDLLAGAKAATTAITKTNASLTANDKADTKALSRVEKVLDFNVWDFSTNGKDEKEI